MLVFRTSNFLKTLIIGEQHLDRVETILAAAAEVNAVLLKNNGTMINKISGLVVNPSWQVDAHVLVRKSNDVKYKVNANIMTKIEVRNRPMSLTEGIVYAKF